MKRLPLHPFLQQYVESPRLGTIRSGLRFIWARQASARRKVSPTSRQLAWKMALLYPDQAETLGARNGLRPSVDGELHEYVLDM